MKRLAWAGSTLAIAFAASPALAQSPPPAAPAINESGVTSYPPSYFDEFRPTTAMSMVGNIPGFQFDSGGSARGQSVNAGNVLIDGRRPPAGNDNVSSVLSRIPASGVERIDVIRGGAPGIDMMGKPIVANVIRKREANISGAVSLNVDTDGQGTVNHNASINAQRQAGDTTLDGSASLGTFGNVNTSRSLRISPDGDILQDAIGTGEFRFKEWDVTTAYERPLLGGNIRVNGQFSEETDEGRFENQLVIPGGVETSANSGEGWDAEVGARYSRNFGARKLETVFLQQITDGTSISDFSTPGISQFVTSGTRTGQSVLTQSITFPSWGKWTIEGGGEVAYNWFTTGSAYVVNGVPFAIAGDGQEVDELRTEAFASASWNPRPSLSGQFALRFERSTLTAVTTAGDEEQTFTYLKPRVNLSWRPKAGHELATTLQMTVSQLSFNEFAISRSPITGDTTITNPGVEPEKTWSLDTRYQRTWGRRGNFTVQHTYRHVLNPLASIIVITPSGDPDDPLTPQNEALDYEDQRSNIEAASYHQFRVSANVPMERFGLKDTYVNGSLALRHSTWLDPITLHERRAGGEAPFDWNVGVSKEYDGGKFIWRLGANGRDDTRGYGSRSLSWSESAVFVNGSVSWRPTDTVILSANASTNVGSNENRSVSYIDDRSLGIVRWTTQNFNSNVPRFSVGLRKSF